MLDDEGWPSSQLYKSGEGRVVFNDWSSLWGACLDFLNDKRSQSSIGNWQNILDDLDPFRDGKAAERMGSYLQWLLDGLKEGKDRETVMENAADRYGKIWGHNNILKVRS